MKVAAAQIECEPGDIGANVAAHRCAIDEARAAGIDLLVFPELSLTDYESEPNIKGLARPRDCDELRDLAVAGVGMTLLVGFIERGSEGRAYNACAVLEGGHVVHVHRKLNLPTYGALVEGRHYAPGERVDAVATAAGKLATLICADSWNPALPWLAALGGAEVVAIPVASARGAVSDEFDSQDGWRLNARHTALTYGVLVVVSNHCGRRGALDFWGGSAIYDAHGRELARGGEDPCLVSAEVDLSDGVAARQRLPTMRDATPGIVAAELRRWLAERRDRHSADNWA